MPITNTSQRVSKQYGSNYDKIFRKSNNNKKECISCKHFNTNISFSFGNGKCELTKEVTNEILSCSKYIYYN